MINISQNVINAFNQNTRIIAELVGLPGRGVSSSAISILKILSEQYNAATIYLYSSDSSMNHKMYKKLAARDTLFYSYKPDESYCNLLDTIEMMASKLDTTNFKTYILIDDFARVILNLGYKNIKKFMSSLQILVIKYNLNIVFTNQFRYNLNQKEDGGQYRILYENYLNSYLDFIIEVSKDNETDINVNLLFDNKLNRFTFLNVV